MALLAGCLPPTARRKVEGDIVRGLSFEVEDAGTFERVWTGQTNLQLRSVMEQQETSFGLMLPLVNRFVDPKLLQTRDLVPDAYRLEVWYAHKGWFDARVEGWAVHRVRPRRRRLAGIVDVRGFVTPGPPSLVRTFDIEGGDAVGTHVRATRRTSPLDVGEQFDLDLVYLARDSLLDRLANHGYPYAEAEVDVVAYPEDLAVDVGIDLDPGRLAVLGPITVTGIDAVPEDLVRATLPIAPGDVYDASELARTQRRLFGLGAFSLVNVRPDLSDPTVGEVPVEIDLTEAEFQSLRLGGGVEFDGVNVSPRISTRYGHVNLFRRLVRLDLEGSAGYAYTLGSGALTTGTPTWTLGSELEIPRLFGSDVTLATGLRYERDVQFRQFLYERPEVDATLAWRLNDAIVVRGGVHWERFLLLGLDEPVISTAIERIYGWSFREDGAYQLGALDAAVTVDWRDDAVDPSRGSFWELRARQAVPLGPADFNYTELSAEVRGYRPITLGSIDRTEGFPWTLAARARGQWLGPWGDRKLPYPERVFLGGVDDLRGFRQGQVGPYDVVCVPVSQDEVGPRYLPEGGSVGTLASGEVRYDGLEELGWQLAAFADAGTLTLADTPGRTLFRWNVGVGARYKSFVGPIRIDLAFRPPYPEDYGPQEPGEALEYVGCPGSERRARSYGLAAAFRGATERYDTIRPPVIQLHLAIGQAF